MCSFQAAHLLLCSFGPRKYICGPLGRTFIFKLPCCNKITSYFGHIISPCNGSTNSMPMLYAMKGNIKPMGSVSILYDFTNVVLSVVW